MDAFLHLQDHSYHQLLRLSDSLLQYALRAIYQTSIWYTSLQSVQEVPSPEGWGWCDVDNTWKPV